MKDNLLFKVALVCIIVTFFFAFLILTKVLLIPMITAALIAMVLLPLCKILERKMFKMAAISACILLLVSVVSGLIFLFYFQIRTLTEDIPLFKTRATEKFAKARLLIESKTGISGDEQLSYINGIYNRWAESSGFYIQDMIAGITEAFAVFGLIIVYIFFFLLYRLKIKNFILKLFPEKNHMRVSIILNHTQDMSQNYLTGLLIELFALGTLNTIGLLIIGVKQAVFWGYLAGFLNIIPYIGVLIGSIFPIFIAFIFNDIGSALAVVLVMTFNQFIDNNFLTPKIVGAHIQVNALSTIVIIIAGGIVWGLPGMILFIPLLGIFKIVCDFVITLHPLSYLLGEDMDMNESSGSIWVKLKNVFSY